jgi:hypothetical protein
MGTGLCFPQEMRARIHIHSGGEHRVHINGDNFFVRCQIVLKVVPIDAELQAGSEFAVNSEKQNFALPQNSS